MPHNIEEIVPWGFNDIIQMSIEFKSAECMSLCYQRIPLLLILICCFY